MVTHTDAKMPQQMGYPDEYNVVWTSPSPANTINGSMPLGNGDIALNVWVEADGDLILLLAKSDAWDENAILCKLGRLRMRFTPNPFRHGYPFLQSLILSRGEIEIVAGHPNSAVTIHIRVDANAPVIHIDSAGQQAYTQEIILETWRDAERVVSTEMSDLFNCMDGPDPYPTTIYPDVIVPDQANQIVWYHHNRPLDIDGFVVNMTLQGLDGVLPQTPHPLLGRTFGAAITGAGLVTTTSHSLQSAQPTHRQSVAVYPLTLHPSTPDDWLTTLHANITTLAAVDQEDAYQAHLAWWQQFWERSWIQVTEDAPVEYRPDAEVATAFEVAQAYQLCRFMNACAGRGAQPIKFNGSLFTVGTPDNPDYRRWGGPGFWHQNERLVYWPMLAAGDYDLLAPWFRMYRDILPLMTYRTQHYFAHAGAFFGESITFWGTEASAHYGWTPFAERESPLCACPYITYHWQSGLEQLLMMYDYFQHTGDAEFAHQTLLPHADAVTLFYDLHYLRQNGVIHFTPAQSLETWQSAVNPLPEIAGLHALLPKLLALPDTLLTAPLRERWQRMQNELPPLPSGSVREHVATVRAAAYACVSSYTYSRWDALLSELDPGDDPTMLLPAEQYAAEENFENPELYAIFPYRLFGIGKDALEMARRTFAYRLHTGASCWSQDDIQMAYLGLAKDAREHLVRRASRAESSESRFPAFFNPHYDWNPDVDHSGVLQLALQAMLLQCDDQRILLLPAWPEQWNAKFRLHAPFGTIVEGTVSNGELQELIVTPEHRRKDVELITRSPRLA